MEVTKKNIQEYIAKDGKNHFRDWLDSLKDIRTMAKIDVRLGRLRLGNFGSTNSVGKGVYELKINFGPGYRIYYGLEGSKIVILLCGGDKSSQKRGHPKSKNFVATI